MMTRTTKEQEVSSLVEKFQRAKAAFLVDFKGLKVEQVTSLRKKLHPSESEMKVVRNTLARRALKNFPEMENSIGKAFTGTNAIVFAYGDISASAKVLATFAKDIELLQLKSGVMDGKALDASKIQYLSNLPTKDVLRAMLLGTLLAPASKLVRTINEPASSLARVLAAKKD